MTVAAGIINYNKWNELEVSEWDTAYYTEMGTGIWSLAVYGLKSLSPKLAAFNIWLDVITNMVSMYLVYRASDISESDSNSTTIAYVLHGSAALLSAAVGFMQMAALNTWLEGFKGGDGSWGAKDGDGS